MLSQLGGVNFHSMEHNHEYNHVKLNILKYLFNTKIYLAGTEYRIYIHAVHVQKS